MRQSPSLSSCTFDVWTVNEPEFMRDTEYKFNILTHPISVAMGTGGKNDHLAKETIGMLAPWALRKLFVACVKVLWWITQPSSSGLLERQGN